MQVGRERAIVLRSRRAVRRPTAHDAFAADRDVGRERRALLRLTRNRRIGGMVGGIGMAPAIANAVLQVTGRRLRHLPIRIEDLL